MLDEQALRRDDFAEGVPIILADGQAWHFPRPVLEIVPRFDAEGALVSLGSRDTFGPEYDRLLDTLSKAEDFADRLQAVVALAVDLLGRNYDLCAEDYRTILRYRPSDPKSLAMWQQIAEAATGQAPKPTPVGSEPA